MPWVNQVVNVVTGKVIKIDPEQARLSRMRRRIGAWSEVVKELEHDRGRLRKVMIRLSYDTEGTQHEKPYDWKPNHIRDYVKKLKTALGDNALALAWAAEMQKKGTVHYHLYLIVPRGTKVPMPDKSGMWPWGSSRIETGRSSHYLIAYMKNKGKEKAYQKQGFPKGCRIFSVWVRKKEVRTWTWTKFRWSALPSWLRSELERFGFAFVGLFPVRKEGGGWIVNIPPDRMQFFGWKHSKIEFYSPWIMA